MATLEKVLAPELTYVHSSGVLDSKDAYIWRNQVRQDEVQVDRAEEVSARSFGEWPS